MSKTLTIALTILMAAGAARAADIQVLYNERPPFMSAAGGEVKGLTADVAAKALKAAGVVFTWSEVPAARQLDMIKQGTDPVCGLGWFKNPEREGFARFTKPLYQDKPMAVLGRAKDQRLAGKAGVDALMTDPALTLLVKKAYSYGGFLDDKAAKLNPKKSETTVEANAMFKQIGAERADYMFVSAEEGDLLLKSAEGAALALYAIPDMPAGGQRYLMCSKAVPAEVIAKIDAALP